MAEYEFHSDFSANLMSKQFCTDLKFHPRFRQLLFNSELTQKLTSKIGDDVKEFKNKPIILESLLTVNTGKYELLFDGFFPLLDVNLNEEFLQRLFSKREKLEIQGNYWLVESHRIAKLISNSFTLYGKQAFCSKSVISPVIHFNCEGYLLMKVKIVPVRIIVTETHLV